MVINDRTGDRAQASLLTNWRPKNRQANGPTECRSPALDRYLQIGFRQMGLGRASLNPQTLKKIGDFYKDNQADIDTARVPTLDFLTGQETELQYSRAKIIDMVFFPGGRQAELRKAALSASDLRWSLHFEGCAGRNLSPLPGCRISYSSLLCEADRTGIRASAIAGRCSCG
jgi:hypothetical protein